MINLKNIDIFIPYLPFKTEGQAERERFHVPEGCLLLCPTALKTSEVHPVLLGRSVIQIPLSMFWPGTDSTNFYKATDAIEGHAIAIEGLNMARDTLIFLLQQLGFIINLEK